MEKLILIKLGGSLITDKNKPFKVHRDLISSLVDEIIYFCKKSQTKVVLGHGGGSFSHPPSKKYNVSSGIKNKLSLRGIAQVQDSGAALNRIVVSEFVRKNYPAISMNPSSFLITKNSEIELGFVNPIVHALNEGLVPVVYGDVIFDTYQGCSDISTEKIFRYLINELNTHFEIDKIIYCGLTDGVYDKLGRVAPLINSKNMIRYKKDIKGSHGVDVTGGMKHKVEESLKIAKLGIDTYIINGNKTNNLTDCLAGKKFSGTLISEKFNQ